jgi:hypothetical protein
MHSISNIKGYCCVLAQELIRGDTPYIKQIKIEKDSQKQRNLLLYLQVDLVNKE